LPLEKHLDEVLKIKVRPQTVKEEDVSVLMALPKHEVTQTLHTASSHEDVEWRIAGCVHVLVYRLLCDVFGIGQIR
jgi:hypothetical protein